MCDELHNLPQRLSEVRTLANLSQSELAGKLGVSASLISHWEKGTRTPSESQLLDLARHLGVALDYLLNAEIRPTFQCRARATGPQRDDIERTLLDASMQVHYVDTALRLAKKTPVPFSLWADLNSFDNLPNIAAHLRDTLKLNRRITLDEFKQALSEWNISVFDWAMPLHLSGLSFRGPFTVIFINSEHSTTRRLFTLAHEFAHVVFHLGREDRATRKRVDTVVSIASHRDPQEKEANAFASELLMPKSDVEQLVKTYGDRLRDPASLQTVARHFNVSRDAMFYRLTQLGVFSWSEKSTYFTGTFEVKPPPPVRVEKIDAQVDARFRDLAISLHQAGEITTGKLAEWLFTPRHVVEEYLAELARAKVMGISDGANHEGEHAGA
jgi:Zn-dependent peptidase ImmA (M78 family)/transcriptional regulator with XRE-family HTH domain